MVFIFRALTIPIFILGIGLSLSMPASAEKSRKLKSIATKNVKFEPLKETVQKEPKWIEEPTSFLGVQLDKPLSNSVSANCPMMMIGNTAFVDKKLIPEGELCYEKNPPKESDIPGNFGVYPSRVSPLQSPSVTTQNNDLSGEVGQIISTFRSEEFYKLKEILVAKYGPPHKQNTGKLKTNGGKEFDNFILDWSGERVSIHVESLESRFFSFDDLIEYGHVYVRSQLYIESQNEIAKAKAQEAASKL